jgi:hypothetical protein
MRHSFVYDSSHELCVWNPPTQLVDSFVTDSSVEILCPIVLHRASSVELGNIIVNNILKRTLPWKRLTELKYMVAFLTMSNT